ncbi:MAG: hypothetical protein QM811_10905 [Pirellulales bacterium]
MCDGRAVQLKLVKRSILYDRVGLNDQGELMVGLGEDLIVGKPANDLVHLMVQVAGEPKYLSVSSAGQDAPKLVLLDKPDDAASWKIDEIIPRQQLQRDSPAWGATRFQPAKGAFDGRVLAAGKDNKLTLIPALDVKGDSRSIGRRIHWDNLNDGK